MSIGSLPPPRRVRHQAPGRLDDLDALAVMGFSALASLALTLAMLLVSALGR